MPISALISFNRPCTRLTLSRAFVKTRIVTLASNRLLKLAILIGVIAAVTRLILITQPFVDEWSWRQSDVAAIARNYFSGGFDFAHPQIDWAGNQPGYVGTEFPILPFIAALSYRVFGVHEWIGRLQGVIFFAVSLPFFYLLIRDKFDEPTATFALIFYSFAPLLVMTSRCFMPDVPSLTLSIVGLYFFSRWLGDERWGLFVCAAVATALALLIKLPGILIGAPMLFVACDKFGRRIYAQWKLWLFAFVTLLPCLLWYGHAAGIARMFYPHHFFGAGGVRIMNPSWYWQIMKGTFLFGLTPVLSLLAAVGLLMPNVRRRGAIWFWWLVATVIFILLVGYGNRHPWYQLPLVPVAAAFAGGAVQQSCARIGLTRWAKLALTAALLGTFIIASYASTCRFYHPAAADLRRLGLALAEKTPSTALVVVADYGDPTALYYAQRKGWHFLEKDGIYNGHPVTSQDAIDDFEKLRECGATHLAFYSASFWWLEYYKQFAQHLEANSTVISSSSQWKIYQLTSAPLKR